MERKKLLEDIAFAVEKKKPDEDPDDFADLVTRVRAATGTDVQPFLGLWQKVRPYFGDQASQTSRDIASGRMMPTPDFRRRFVRAVKDWLKEAMVSHGSDRP